MQSADVRHRLGWGRVRVFVLGDLVRDPETSGERTSSSDVTAVIPTYNASATIGRCLASITSQTTPPAWIIVVDDCSTDGSPAIVRELHIPNLQLVELPANRGVAAARNVGIQRATTEFVAFLDADDIWRPRFVELVRRAIAESGAQCGSAGGVRVSRNRAPRERTLKEAGPSAMDLTDSFWHVAAMRFMPIRSSGVIASRSLLLDVGGFAEDVRRGEDLLTWIKLWQHGRLAFVNESLFESIAPPDGLTAGEFSYRDVRVGLSRAGMAVLEALRSRRRGAGWFAVWWGRRFLSSHAEWLRKRLQPAAPWTSRKQSEQ